MTLREVYADAIEEEFEWLTLLIEFLVLEKEVLAWDSDYKELDHYFKPNNKAKMNKLLIEYKEETQ